MIRFWFFLLLLAPFTLIAQSEDGAQITNSIDVFFTDEIITLDGVMDEAIWNRCIPAKDFSQYFPNDSVPAISDTEVYFAYDDEYLHVAIIAHTLGDNFLVENLKRDYGFRGSDNISLLFDSFNDYTNSYLFGINSYGARREALVVNGGRQGSDFDNSWDNKWFGNAKQYDDKFIAELSIPFKAIRFKESVEKWRIQIYRFDSQSNEITTLTDFSRNYVLMNMSFMYDLNFEEPLERTGNNLTVIPYVIGSATSDFEDNIEDPSLKFNAGGEVKYGITSGLNLDLTINPDFSQVEVDQQVTNLDRFEIFFPERRQFFLENADLFSGFGKTTLNPFFSRRIGVAIDTATGVNIQNQVHYGARLNGKINEGLRIGILNMQTAADEINDVPIFNYSILALQQRVFQKSNIAFLALNKLALGNKGLGESLDPYNRLAGIEYRHFSNNDKWYGKLSFMRAFSASEKEHNWANLSRIGYNIRGFTAEWEHTLVGNGFDAEVGFVPRRDIFSMSPFVRFEFFPQESSLSSHSIELGINNFFKLGKEPGSIVDEFKEIDGEYNLRYNMSFRSGARFNVRLRNKRVFLLDDFDPTRVQEDDVFLSAGTDYSFSDFRLSYDSDSRKIVSYEVDTRMGQFFNGQIYGFQSELNYRLQPYGVISMNVNFNRIELQDPFVPANLWLIGPKFDLSFSKQLFFTTFIQYNNQLDNLNINARLQWRYKPASDIFIVYTDNYITEPFDQLSSRNKAFVLKMNYWLSL